MSQKSTRLYSSPTDFVLITHQIVPPESSSLDDSAQRPRTLDKNHRDMVKFSGKDDQGYEWVKQDLEELMEKAVDFEKRQNLGMHPSPPMYSKDLHEF